MNPNLSSAQFDSLEVKPDVVKVRRGEYEAMVMALPHGGAGGYASHRPVAGESGESVAEARFDKDGTVENIGVAGHHQRRGVGTLIWDAAQHLHAAGGMPEPKHAVERTDAGDAWARKVGGPLPSERKQVYRN